MTSANVTNYTIRNEEGEIVGTHRQHALCHTRWHRLWKFTPWTKHTITAHWEDEHEAPHEDEPRLLSEFLSKRGYSISEGKRILNHAEAQRDLLKEWVDRIGLDDLELKQKTEKLLLYGPL
jgi:hypothetical protein